MESRLLLANHRLQSSPLHYNKIGYVSINVRCLLKVVAIDFHEDFMEQYPDVTTIFAQMNGIRVIALR